MTIETLRAGVTADEDDGLTTMTASLDDTAIQEERVRPRPADGVEHDCLGDRIGGRLGAYRIERLLGRGSMACVYKARHLELERDCALKIMDSGLVSRQPDIREQFRAEARAVANLLHPHVVTIYNLGNAEDHHFIEMEYVPGGRTLRDTLVHDGPLDPFRAATLAPGGAGPRGGPRIGAGPSRHQAGQRPADQPGRRQARRLRPGPPAG